MHSLLDVAAPAKLNTFLHVTGRRSDGYHLLESVFMLINWCDTLHFEVRSDGKISREDLGTPLPIDDLIVRAARALQAATGTPLGVHISVDKQIPSQAGLGGGSSDAASTLLALNRLWRLKLAPAQLMPIGLKLGADVPFFLSGTNAWVSGIGERVEPVTLPAATFILIKPEQGVATERIFSDSALKRNSKPATILGFATDPYNFGCNDLQAVAQRICPGISEALACLKTLGLDGRMTGSGSTVFARTLGEMEIQAIPGFQIKQCGNLPLHPLYGWAG